MAKISKSYILTLPHPQGHRMSVKCEELSKIEKVPRGIQGEKSSKDMASSRNLVSTIGAQASPKKRDETRCPEGYTYRTYSPSLVTVSSPKL